MRSKQCNCFHGGLGLVLHSLFDFIKREPIFGAFSESISSRVTKCRSVCLIVEERMAEGLKHSENPWMTTAEQSSRMAEFNKDVSLMSESMVIVDGVEASEISQTRTHHLDVSSGGKLGLPERAFSAAGAAFLSAILVNPLDVAKVHVVF